MTADATESRKFYLKATGDTPGELVEIDLDDALMQPSFKPTNTHQLYFRGGFIAGIDVENGHYPLNFWDCDIYDDEGNLVEAAEDREIPEPKEEVFYVTKSVKSKRVYEIDPNKKRWQPRKEETKKRKHYFGGGMVHGVHFDAGYYLVPFWDYFLFEDEDTEYDVESLENELGVDADASDNGESESGGFQASASEPELVSAAAPSYDSGASYSDTSSSYDSGSSSGGGDGGGGGGD